MKSTQGITIIELVVVMIIMLLVVSFAVYSGINSTQKAEATELYTEMNSIKTALSVIKGKMIIEDKENDEEWLKKYYDESMGSGDWYIIYGVDDAGYEESTVRENLGIDNIKRRYLINFEQEDVMLASPVEVLGSSVRTYDAVRSLVDSDKL